MIGHAIRIVNEPALNREIVLVCPEIGHMTDTVVRKTAASWRDAGRAGKSFRKQE